MLGSIIGSVINAGAGLLGQALTPQMDPGDQFTSAFKAKMKMGRKFGISKLVMAGVPANHTPMDSSIGSTIADMGANIGGAVARHMDAPQRQAQQLTLDKLAAENELIRAQTRSVNMRTVREATPPRPPGMGLPVPSGALSAVAGHRMEQPAMTTMLNAGGTTWGINPAWSDAANWENRYGETISDWFIGPTIGVADAYHNTPAINSWPIWDYVRAFDGGVRGADGRLYSTGGSF